MNKLKIHTALWMLLPAILIPAALTVVNCKGASYRDGSWQGKSGVDDTGAWGEITITIEQGKVSGCKFLTRQKDGTVKAEDYGKINGEISNADYYEKAQLAVRAMERYAQQYAQTGKLSAVDAVSGATIAYNQFIEAAEQALKAAKNKL
ncbi:MAG: FMN-binding protein [Spirochaetaceae bacterium]|jgi:major membrane immunogen (membrane-anchored lipoprotein)|nr:FMN-binding protein [Spirochaetaceae bacterium]